MWAGDPQEILKGTYHRVRRLELGAAPVRPADAVFGALIAVNAQAWTARPRGSLAYPIPYRMLGAGRGAIANAGACFREAGEPVGGDRAPVASTCMR